MLVPHLITSTDDAVVAALTDDGDEIPVAIVCRKLRGQESWEPLNALTTDGLGELPDGFELSRHAAKALDEILQVA